MKTWILAMAMMIGVGVNAQDKRERPEPLKPEQRAEIQAKKMTLALDLNEKQQKDIQKILLDTNKKSGEFRTQRKANKEAGKKPTADERFAMENKMLDDRIARQREFKKILTPEQFEKFQAMKKDRHEKMGHAMHKKGQNFKKHHRE